MTILDHRPLPGRQRACCPPPVRTLTGPARIPVRHRPVGPARTRPAAAPLAYRGHGIAMSRVAHGHRPVSTRLTAALAGLAALITLWLGVLAHFSGEGAAVPAAAPDRLAVVVVQAGESLQQLAARVSPAGPADRIVEQIKDLNQLDSAAVDAGQTLIAPIS